MAPATVTGLSQISSCSPASEPQREGHITSKAQMSQTKQATTGHALGHYGVMSYNLQGWLRESGMGPMTEDEFKANPTAQDQLALFKIKQYQDKFGSANAAAIAWFGGRKA